MLGLRSRPPRASVHTSPPRLVSEVVHTAVTDGTDQPRDSAGADELLAMRARMDDQTFMAMMEG